MVLDKRRLRLRKEHKPPSGPEAGSIPAIFMLIINTDLGKRVAAPPRAKGGNITRSGWLPDIEAAAAWREPGGHPADRGTRSRTLHARREQCRIRGRVCIETHQPP